MSGQLALRLGTGSVASHHPEWMEKASRLIDQLAETGQEFTAETLRRALPEPPDPNCMGSAFRAAQRAGVIRATGFRQASRQERQGGVLRTWVGT